jgi:magnesium-transporting ATPase (P-type)
LESLLPRCSRLSAGGTAIALGTEERRTALEAEAALAQRGYRVLAFARRETASRRISEDDEKDMLLCGLVALEDPLRDEVPAAVSACRSAGIRVVMITGDHPHTAQAVAVQAGLFGGDTEARVIDGTSLAQMPESELQLALASPEIAFARISAEQKRRIVSALKRKGEVVAVTGDGVNDAPALREAHIGIAMGRSGTDVAKAAADMVLLDDNFASIVAAIEEGRAVFDNIRKFLAYILSSNVPEAVPYLVSVLAGIPLPLTILQILAVDLGTDMLPALALGAEAPAPDVMQRSPRKREEGLIDAGLLCRAFLWLGAFEALAAMSAYFAVMFAGGWQAGQFLPTDAPLYLQGTSACFSAIVLMQMVNVWMCRSERAPAFSRGAPPVSRLLTAGVLLEALCLGLIVWTPAGNAVFGTAPVPAAGLLAVLPCAVALLLGEECRKWMMRQRRAAQH